MTGMRSDDAQLVNLDRSNDVRVEADEGKSVIVAHDPITHRSYRLGAYGSAEEASAALDRLAAELRAITPMPAGDRSPAGVTLP